MGEARGYSIYQNDNKCDSERDKNVTEILNRGLLLQFGVDKRQGYYRPGYPKSKDNEITEATCWCLTIKSNV